MPSKTGGSEKPTETSNRPSPIRTKRDLAKQPRKLFMTRKTSSSSNNASQPKAPACDFFMKDPSLMPSLDLHPVDAKRWLDFVPAQHGPVQNGKRPNRWETILTLRQQLQTQLMSHHAVDYMDLLHQYGVGSAPAEVDILEDRRRDKLEGVLLSAEPIGREVEKDFAPQPCMNTGDHNGTEDEEDEEEEEGRGALVGVGLGWRQELQGHGECSCKLTIHPSSGDTFEYWAITDGGPEIFHPLQATTLVYLYIRFGWQGKEVEFSMQDRIIWFDGNMVMAMAEIDVVHQDAIIVVDDGLVVPVSASFWPRVLPLVDLEKSCPIYGDEETQAEYDQILFDKPRCPPQSKQIMLWHKGLDDRPLPRLANALGINLGNHVFIEVEDGMKKMGKL